MSERTDRTLVTRDQEFAARAPDSILLDARDPDDQLSELHTAGIGLSMDTEPTRCGRCNGQLRPVEPTASLPTYVPDEATTVWNCSACGQYFWKGSHWSDVRDRITAAVPSQSTDGSGTRDE